MLVLKLNQIRIKFYLAKNLIAIIGKIEILNNISEHAKEMMNGVVTCFRIGV
jgi:hypothetical protein